MKIIADTSIPYVKDYFSTVGDLVLKPGRAISRNDVKDADMLLVRSITRVDEQLLGDSRVRFVGSVTAGADHLDEKWLKEAGISYATAAGFNAPPVADYVVSVLAALQRKKLVGLSPTVAIIGVGHAGKQVAERLALLHCDVILCDPIRALAEKEFESVPLQEIADVDVVTLHVPLTKEGDYPTYHLIEKTFLKRQKPGCVLINASRGDIVSSTDLILHGIHLQWCLDVWEGEPVINKNILQRAVIGTPHIAGYSVESKMRGVEMIYRLACEKNIISSQTVAPPEMHRQPLRFAGDQHHWQDVVLGVFNPLVLTAMMRSVILSEENSGSLFDQMRSEFTYRHELGLIDLVDVTVTGEDARILTGLGMHIFTSN